VALITGGKDLADVRSVSLDTSSRTSVVLTKIIFREFLGFEPEWREAAPDLDAMLDESDCALLIGDPALSIADCGLRIADSEDGNAERGMRNVESPSPESKALDQERSPSPSNSAFRIPRSAFRKFDLAELWRHHTDLGFFFAMWMTRAERPPVDFAAARDEGVERVDEIVSNYLPDIRIGEDEFRTYLSQNISYTIDDELQRGMELYFDLAKKHRLCEKIRELNYTN
jgi:chorismate dehydratase